MAEDRFTYNFGWPQNCLSLSLVFLAVSQIVFFFIFKNKAVSSENQTQHAESLLETEECFHDPD